MISEKLEAAATRFVRIDCMKENPKIRSYQQYREALEKSTKREQLKYDMFVNKIAKEQKTDSLSDATQTFLKQTVGPALGLRNLSQIIEHVKARDLAVQCLLLGQSFADLAMAEPPIEESEEEVKAD